MCYYMCLIIIVSEKWKATDVPRNQRNEAAFNLAKTIQSMKKSESRSSEGTQSPIVVELLPNERNKLG